MTTVKVTPRMLATITAIQRFRARHGYKPSYRELLTSLGLSRKAVASAKLRMVELQRAGVINRIPQSERAYEFKPGITIVCEYPRKEKVCVSEEGLPK